MSTNTAKKNTTKKKNTRSKKAKPPAVSFEHAKKLFEAAKQISVCRGDPIGIYPKEDLEPGVKYFVLMLEQLDATTFFSCEGHPDGFYVVFTAPYSIALAVQACGFFNVEISDVNTWRLALGNYRKWTEQEKEDTLILAVQSWEQSFGPLRHYRLQHIYAENKFDDEQKEG